MKKKQLIVESSLIPEAEELKGISAPNYLSLSDETPFIENMKESFKGAEMKSEKLLGMEKKTAYIVIGVVAAVIVIAIIYKMSKSNNETSSGDLKGGDYPGYGNEDKGPKKSFLGLTNVFKNNTMGKKVISKANPLIAGLSGMNRTTKGEDTLHDLAFADKNCPETELRGSVNLPKTSMDALMSKILSN